MDPLPHVLCFPCMKVCAATARPRACPPSTGSCAIGRLSGRPASTPTMPPPSPSSHPLDSRRRHSSCGAVCCRRGPTGRMHRGQLPAAPSESSRVNELRWTCPQVGDAGDLYTLSPYRPILRDRPTQYSVFSNFSFSFCFAALSFLLKGIGGVFVDYCGYNKEYSEFEQN